MSRPGGGEGEKEVERDGRGGEWSGGGGMIGKKEDEKRDIKGSGGDWGERNVYLNGGGRYSELLRMLVHNGPIQVSD